MKLFHIKDGPEPRAGIQSTVMPTKQPEFNYWAKYINGRTFGGTKSLMPVKKIYYLTPKQA
jgi:hypothetical protein